MSNVNDKTDPPLPFSDTSALPRLATAGAKQNGGADASGMRVIGRDELKEKLDRGDDFKLVMTYHEWAYRAKHIPGSLNVQATEDALALLDPTDEVVVYCTNAACNASVFAYHFLVSQGYKNVRRYSGGLLDWEESGYQLEGEQA